MARLLPLVLLAIAPCALALAAGAETPQSAAGLWRERMGEARELKLWIASTATALLLFGWALKRMQHGEWLARTRALLLVALSLATLFAWWHPYRGSLRAWLHVGDSFHYFVGAKYFDELGYTRLYHCAAVADSEAGVGPLLARSRMRDLDTNELVGTLEALRDPAHCKRHFTPERWRAFAQDLAFFREKLTVPLWLELRSDHGYNPPPTWTLVGGLLASTGEASRSQFFVLTAIDPLLLAGMFAALGWAFGWRVMCIALIYWGTNQPASWEWVGGSILRFDWLAASVVGLCCLRRERPVAAGVLLAWAAAVRIFPGAIVAGIGLAALVRMLRMRTLTPTPDQRRLALAFAGSLGVIVTLSTLWAGPRSWIDFAQNSRLHLSTESVNRMGLRPLLAYRHESRLASTFDAGAPDPFARWKARRALTSEARQPLRAAIVVCYLALLTFALRRQPDWVAGVLGIGAVPFLLELGNYYFGIIAAFACLAGRREDLGVALLLLASTSWWVGTWGGADRDGVVALTSFATLLFVGFATLRMATPPDGISGWPARVAARVIHPFGP